MQITPTTNCLFVVPKVYLWKFFKLFIHNIWVILIIDQEKKDKTISTKVTKQQQRVWRDESIEIAHLMPSMSPRISSTN